MLVRWKLELVLFLFIYMLFKLVSMLGIDFDVFYCGESFGEGFLLIMILLWDIKVFKDNVIGWYIGGWVYGDVFDIGCGFGDNVIYFVRNGY